MNNLSVFLRRALCVAFAAFCAFFVAPQKIAFADEMRLLECVALTDGDAQGTASLYGRGQNYITELKVKVEFENYEPYEIKLDDGYSPFMGVFDFGGADGFLFCSSQTGGSGGYGNYRVYSVKTQTYGLLYDARTDSENSKFDARFEPNGFMNLTNLLTDNSLKIYLGYMPREFYALIFAPDGSVKDEQPYVNPISFVSPALNPASGLYRLCAYRSVTAVAEVNRLGYIVSALSYDGKIFKPDFTEFSITL